MLRLLCGLVFAAFVLAAPALAAPPTTETTHEKQLVETFVDVVPSCDEGGPLYTITTTSNVVEHVTEFADGRVHGTFTQTGKFTADPVDGSLGLPSYTGQFSTWGNFNQNAKTANTTFTFNVQGTGSDGSTLSNHVNEHFNSTPDGAEHFFSFCH